MDEDSKRTTASVNAVHSMPETWKMEKRKARTLAAPTNDQIAVCAHLIWEKEGRPLGRETEYWYQAEAQLKAAYEHEMRQMRQQQTGTQLPL